MENTNLYGLDLYLASLEPERRGDGLYQLDVYLQEQERNRQVRRERNAMLAAGTGKAASFLINTAGKAVVATAKGAYNATCKGLDYEIARRERERRNSDCLRMYGVNYNTLTGILNQFSREYRPPVLEMLRERAPELRQLYEQEQETRRQQREAERTAGRARRQAFYNSVGRNIRDFCNRLGITTPAQQATTPTTQPAATPVADNDYISPVNLEALSQDSDAEVIQPTDLGVIVEEEDVESPQLNYENIRAYVQQKNHPVETFVKDKAYLNWKNSDRAQNQDFYWCDAQHKIAENTIKALRRETADENYVLPGELLDNLIPSYTSRG